LLRKSESEAQIVIFNYTSINKLPIFSNYRGRVSNVKWEGKSRKGGRRDLPMVCVCNI